MREWEIKFVFHAKFGTLKPKRNGLSNCAVLDVLTGRRNKISLHMIREGGENVVSIRFFQVFVFVFVVVSLQCLPHWLIAPNVSKANVECALTSKCRPAGRAGREEK